ncbi:MAG: SAF domain-containing protein [Acidimicrobiales bacterium]
MNPLRPLRRVQRRILLHRRPLAAVCAAGAALVALQVASPPPPRTVQVWTASRDLSSGTVLAPADLTRTEFMPASVPTSSVTDPRQVLGRTLAAPMTRGEPLTRLRTISRGLLRGYPGTTAVPLRVTDGDIVDLLRVGDRVSFVVADPDGREQPRPLVDDVAVVAIPRRADSGLSSSTPGRLVVAAVPTPLASEIASRAATSILIPVWNR